MNTTVKITAAMLAGVVAGALLVGTAFAAPRMMASPALGGRGMMRAGYPSGGSNGPTSAEAREFMNSYRTATGEVDVNRMLSDVSSGVVAPPCAGRSLGAERTSRAQAGRVVERRGQQMMTGRSRDRGPRGYSMMGSVY